MRSKRDTNDNTDNEQTKIESVDDFITVIHVTVIDGQCHIDHMGEHFVPPREGC